MTIGEAIAIVDLVAAPGLGGFFFDDQSAIRAGAVRDGGSYRGPALTPGYSSVRMPAESVSVMLVLSDGYVATGDCASVQYSGLAGREPRLHAQRLATRLETELAPLLRGLEVTSFRDMAEKVEARIEALDLGRAAAYGVSQALLEIAAHEAGHHLMSRVVTTEWGLSGDLAPVSLYCQSGEYRYDNVDKMILKEVPVLPHGLINHVGLVGSKGELLIDYVGWVRDRIAALATHADYHPVLHLDVYGLLGVVAGGSVERTADIIVGMEKAAGPHQLRVEHPMDGLSRDGQIEVMTALKRVLAERGSSVELIADEWANTVDDIHHFAVAGAADLIQIKTPDLGSVHHVVEAILDCQAHGIGTVLGGSCAETDRSARVTTHIGLATGVTQLLAKPGMGVDEGLSVVNNEMQRSLRLGRRLSMLSHPGSAS